LGHRVGANGVAHKHKITQRRPSLERRWFAAKGLSSRELSPLRDQDVTEYEAYPSTGNVASEKEIRVYCLHSSKGVEATQYFYYRHTETELHFFQYRRAV